LSGHPSQPLPVTYAGHRACTNPERAPAADGVTGLGQGYAARQETEGEWCGSSSTIRSQHFSGCVGDHRNADRTISRGLQKERAPAHAVARALHRSGKRRSNGCRVAARINIIDGLALGCDLAATRISKHQTLREINQPDRSGTRPKRGHCHGTNAGSRRIRRNQRTTSTA